MTMWSVPIMQYMAGGISEVRAGNGEKEARSHTFGCRSLYLTTESFRALSLEMIGHLCVGTVLGSLIALSHLTLSCGLGDAWQHCPVLQRRKP